MAKENTPRIVILGRTNAGKSTLLNFITGSSTAIVSSERGTTTDPVRTRYEVAGLGPATFVDTAGLDDGTPLGLQRTERAMKEASEADLALIVFTEWGIPEEELQKLLECEKMPFLTVFNRFGPSMPDSMLPPPDIILDLSLFTPEDHTALLDAIRSQLPVQASIPVRMFSGMLSAGDHVVLVCPIDGGAPAGRMILPQVQALREILDARAVAHVMQPSEFAGFLDSGIVPKLIVTDSQVYKEIRALTPTGFEVTTFSILLAAAKGDYPLYLKGLEAVSALEDGDRVLIVEFCSHQASCEDIARVKIPAWLRQHTSKQLDFTYLSSADTLPEKASCYALAVVCGGCMATRTQVQARLAQLRALGVPVTNFGLLIREIR